MKIELESSLDQKSLQSIVRAIESIQYGSITVVIQDGTAVQLERLEKIRLR